MTKTMLIDASHAEETRVVVLDGNRLEDFDVETQTKRQLKGNIYLAKVVRVEPSLQAAFVEYGGNRHGFLAFAEIHPDYYQIPVADRQRLLEMQEAEAREDEEDEDGDRREPTAEEREATAEEREATAEEGETEQALTVDVEIFAGEPPEWSSEPETAHAERTLGHAPTSEAASTPGSRDASGGAEPDLADPPDSTEDAPLEQEGEPAAVEAFETRASSDGIKEVAQDLAPPETLGGEDPAEAPERRQPSKFLRNYKIQEVIRRRQVLLIQVVKEERGSKGAALTTYISLAGRYCVLMPNSPRGGGVSRKITSAADRRRLKEITAELDVPRGMGIIVRTAGAARPKPEIRRDCEYLLRLWDDIREQTLRSMAPSLIYEEASLIKRAIRDVYSRDVDEILVDGEEGWRAAREFMRMLMPTHVRKVLLWQDGGQPLFAKKQVEAQLDAMLSPTVQLRSGGYLVIDQTEALVAIDVNSGRSTRERGIEETALRTNLEAAEELGRQLRLRDLAGLIVVDFIDMESKKHNGLVEKRMKDALKDDRARIQVGHISHFGLLEMSRQRLRPSLAETSSVVCPHCGGAGHVRSTENAALHVLRAVEEEGAKRRSAEIAVFVASTTALYILNHKRGRVSDIEARYGMRVCFTGDDTLLPGLTRIEKLRALLPGEAPPVPVFAPTPPPSDESEEEVDDDVTFDEPEEQTAASAPDAGAAGGEAETEAEGERRRKRRRRRRRGGRREDGTIDQAAGEAASDALRTEEQESGDPQPPEEIDAVLEPVAAVARAADPEADLEETGAPKRGRRGGRRRRKEPDSPTPDVQSYTGPTPADPFGGIVHDIFDLMDAVELQTADSLAQTPAPAEPAADPNSPLAIEEDSQTIQDEAEAETPVPEQAAPASAPPTSAPPASVPLIQPTIIAGAPELAEKKRGWWRK